MKLASSFICLLLACAPCGAVLAQAPAGHSELKAIAFSTLDTNKDGKISREEARADAGLYEDFDTLDTNHDGFLSPEEFHRWRRAAPSTTTHDPSTGPGGSAGAQHMPPN